MAGTDEQHSVLLKALADENRLRLARLLWHEELNVQELCDILDMPQPRVSRHLGVMKSANLVNDHREGTRVYYSINAGDSGLGMLADYLRTVAEQPHPDLERMQACLRQRTRQSRDFAQRRAAEWDEIGMQLHSSTAALFALACMAPRGLTIADLGTGTGLLLPILGAFADRVYAVDHAEEMLAYARRRCTEHQLDNVSFICSDLESLPDALPGPCDCMLLHFVLHQIARPGPLLRALAGGLRTGGRLVIVDRVKHDDEDARGKFGSLWLGFEEGKVREWLGAAGLHDAQYKLLRATEQEPDGFAIFIAAAGR